jgi:hypothetical protein
MRCHSCASLTDVLILLGAIDGFHQEAAGPQFNPKSVQGSTSVCTVLKVFQCPAAECKWIRCTKCPSSSARNHWTVGAGGI